MKIPMTVKGYNTLRTELLRLKSTRPELAAAIERARELGDLRENADYEEAKRNSGMVEARIRDLEAKLAAAEIVDVRKLGEPTRVMFGVSVLIENIDTGEQKTYTIVGGDESDIERGFISFESPIAKALIGKEQGDVVKVVAPGGPKEFEISEIFVSTEFLVELEGAT